MRFEVSPELFELLPDAVFGVVAVRGADNSREYPEISALLRSAAADCAEALAGVKVKESPDIVPYREAFRALGINPNKFMCSIEALMTRIAKGKGFPEISPIVDLGNAVSLRTRLPIGAHDMGTVERALEVRHAREGDTFVPFGGGEVETPDENEVVYVSGGQVRSENGSEADIALRIFGQMGIAKDMLIAENQSRNTAENARRTRELLEKRGLRKVVVVSPALHAPRVRLLFAREGLDVVMYPSHYRRSRDWNFHLLMDIMPTAENLNDVSDALHEYLGLLAIRLGLY